MKALLSMDSFKLLSDYYGGQKEIRSMQQKFNRTYEDYIGLIPCDGVYGRSTSRALVYALQAEEGMPVGVATGNFGPATRSLCPQIPYVRDSSAAKDYNGNYYSDYQLSKIIELLQFGLFLNGFGDGVFDGKFNPVTQQAVLDFQEHYALPKTGIVDLDTWMSLFISSGNPDRPAIAADCATILNEAKAKTLYDNGYRYIGRYLTGTYGGGISKALTGSEANIILDAGLRFFPIYQTSSNSESYFTEERAIYDAQAAISASDNLGLPAGTIIYFAVDFDAMDYQITDSVLPYFAKVSEIMATSSYKVGVYGARNVCSRVSNAGYACSSFVGDMSTGFSGNLGFKIPDNWAFSQFANLEGENALGSGDGRIEIDKNAFSGRDQGVSKLRSSKKAIYVLPGYMGSRLYTSDGEEYWADQNKLTADITDYILWGELSDRKDILRLDSNGENSKVHTDISKDFYGTPLETGGEGTYKNLVTALKNECKGYDVVFFPYNWLADLNDSSEDLQNHINNNGYEKVVFVTHSTGGLLASSYIARSQENKRKVEKAILIAAPLFGTYDALNPLETGEVPMISDTIAAQLEGEWYEDIAKPLVYWRTFNFVRKAVHNSPTTYQLLPSLEYLKLMPQIYENEFDGSSAVTSLNDYYSILNGSSNINSKLTNGGKRSHSTFRNNIGDIVSVLQSVDTTLIGTSKGYKTFAIANYKENVFGNSELIDITKKDDGDGTVLNVSAFALTADGKHRIKFKDFANDGKYSHFDLAMRSKPIQYVCDTINGKVSASPAEELTMSSAYDSEAEGMSANLKINYKSNEFLTINIFDTNNVNVAQISENKYFGFNENDDRFSFTPLNFDESNNHAVIYMPNYGYKIVFSYGETTAEPVEFEAEISTLDADGWKSVSVKDTKTQTAANGIIASYDGTMNTINSSNISDIISGTTQSYLTEWTLPDILEIDINDIQTVDIIGTDAVQISSSLLWSSSDDSVVSVSSDGTITGAGYGKATVTATDGNKTESCEVTVRQNASAVSLSDITMTVGEKTVIAPTFVPAAATQTDMVYTYEKGTVIKIDEFGVIHALAAGTITVTGTTDYGVTDTFVVTVSDSDFNREPGDVNGDGDVNIIDLIRAKKQVAGIIALTGISFDAADLDSNNVVNAVDLSLLRKMLLETNY